MTRQRRFVDCAIAAALMAVTVAGVGLARTAAATDTAGSGSSFVGLTPTRLADSRPGEATIDGVLAGGGARAAGSVTTVPVGGRAGVPTNAIAVAVNVTVTQATGPGYATVYPCGTPPPLSLIHI